MEVILRLLTARRLYGWSYAEAAHVVGDSLILRQFCRLGLERVPDDTTLLRWANTLRPATLEWLLDHVVDLARHLKVTGGGSCGSTAPWCGPRSTTRPTPACWLTACGCWAG